MFEDARLRGITEIELGMLADRHDAYNHWQPLNLWPDFPHEDFQLWHFIA